MEIIEFYSLEIMLNKFRVNLNQNKRIPVELWRLKSCVKLLQNQFGIVETITGELWFHALDTRREYAKNIGKLRRKSSTPQRYSGAAF